LCLSSGGEDVSADLYVLHADRASNSFEIEAIFCLLHGVTSQRTVMCNNYPDSAIQLSYCILHFLGVVN
jgi:hypothetical protein